MQILKFHVEVSWKQWIQPFQWIYMYYKYDTTETIKSLITKATSLAVTFLEYWKRKNASLAHHWDCMGFQVSLYYEIRLDQWDCVGCYEIVWDYWCLLQSPYIPIYIIYFVLSMIFSGWRRTSKARVCCKGPLPGEKPNHRSSWTCFPKSSKVRLFPQYIYLLVFPLQKSIFLSICKSFTRWFNADCEELQREVDSSCWW